VWLVRMGTISHAWKSPPSSALSVDWLPVISWREVFRPKVPKHQLTTNLRSNTTDIMVTFTNKALAFIGKTNVYYLSRG